MTETEMPPRLALVFAKLELALDGGNEQEIVGVQNELLDLVDESLDNLRGPGGLA